jgi:translocation and assembly module TamB
VKRLVVILLGAFLLALAMAGGTLVFLAQTEGGTRLLAEQAERFLPVRFEEVTGTLWRAVHVGRLTLEVGDRVVEVEGLAVVLNMLPLLFDNRLELGVVVADDVFVSAVAEGAEPGPPPRLMLPFMPVRIELEQLVIQRLRIADGPVVTLTGSASWLDRGLIVHRLALKSDVLDGILSGELGNGANPDLAAQVSWSLPGSEWAGEGRVRGPVRQLEVTHELRGLVSGRAAGSANLANPIAPVVDLAVALDDMQFGDTLVREVGGRLRGTLDHLEADATGRIATAAVAPFQLHVSAYGPVTGPLTLRNVYADALEGRTEAQGSLAWREGVRLLLGGTSTDVSLATLREALTGRASGDFQLRYEEGLVELTVQDLTGTMNGRPIAGEFTLAQVTGGWHVDPLRLQVASNRLEGSLLLQGDDLDLDAGVVAPALGVLGIGVEGDAAGSVRLTGRWPDLSGHVELESGRLEAFGVSLEQTVLSALLDDGRLQADATADNVRRDQLAMSTARLNAAGTLDQIDWRLRWAEGDVSGAFQRPDDGYLLRVERARMRVLDQDWALENATELRVAGEALHLAPVCIAGNGATACVNAFAYAAGRIETSGRLIRVPVALVQPFLPVRLGNDGYLEGGWSLTGAPGNWQGNLDLAARRLDFVPGPEQGAIDLPDLVAMGTVAGDSLAFRLSASGEAFALRGEGTLTPLATDGMVTAVIDAAASDLAPLRVFAQRIEAFGGRLDGRALVSGPLAELKAEGNVRIIDGQLRLNDPDLALDDLNVTLSLDDSGAFDLRGTAKQRNSEVLLTGGGTGLFGGALRFDAALVAANVRVEHPDWSVRLSPDLTMSYADGRGRVRGRVEVPRAEVRLTALPTSVPSPSDDVVVIGRDTANAGTANPIRVDVDLVLGENVTLKAVGIVAELRGSVRARIDDRGRSTLRGTLDVTGGSLTAQGQTLEIESGTVVYSGPIGRPYIDLRAARTVTEAEPPVKVGLHIRGNADNLTSSMYSEPPMSETRALSFLVLGRDIDQETEGSDSGQLVAAAINLGLSRSQNITSELMRRTGLDELSAMAEAQNSFAIVAGKRVTDQLYVRYTYNTLSALGAFLVRYDLDRRWQLEATSGEHSAMDLMYRFEK